MCAVREVRHESILFAQGISCLPFHIIEHVLDGG